MKKNLLLTLFASALILGACGSENTESESAADTEETETTEDTATETEETEEVTAEYFVESHKRDNLDNILSDYNALTDESIKETLAQPIADSSETLFGKEVVVHGKVLEWHEGSEGLSKGSFIVETDAGNRVRINAKSPNEALDLNETVELVNGTLASPINAEELYVREVSVYIE